MRVKALLRVSIAASAVILGAGPAFAASIRDFDINKAPGWADALAICDVTRFLQTDPDLNIEILISKVPDVANGELRRPYYIPPTHFYSKVMRETFDSVEKTGQVTIAAYTDARYRYARLMLDAYRRATPSDRAFLDDQMKLCYALAVSTQRQNPGAKPAASQ